jgi:hypothetical protein
MPVRYVRAGLFVIKGKLFMAWNQPSKKEVSKPHKTAKFWFGFSILTVIVATLLMLCFFFYDKSSTIQAEKQEVKTKVLQQKNVAKRTTATKSVKGLKTNKLQEPIKWDDSFVTNRDMRIKFSVLASAQTNDSGVVTERYRMPNGKYWLRQIDPPPIFENPSDNAIAMALGDRSGAPIPPYPGINDIDLDEQFAKSLASPIAINDDDKPWVVALKVAVQETRKEIAALIKAGDKRSVGEILLEHIQENNRAANLQGEAWKGYNNILKNDGEEAAAEYLNKVNEHLEKYGVAPIKIKTNNGEDK